MPIYSLAESRLSELTRTSFAEQGIGERKDLQAVVRGHAAPAALKSTLEDTLHEPSEFLRLANEAVGVHETCPRCLRAG